MKRPPPRPFYPITVRHPDGSVESWDDERSLCADLAEFDSENPEYLAVVTDAVGRRVRLRTGAGSVKLLEVAFPDGGRTTPPRPSPVAAFAEWWADLQERHSGPWDAGDGAISEARSTLRALADGERDEVVRELLRVLLEAREPVGNPLAVLEGQSQPFLLNALHERLQQHRAAKLHPPNPLNRFRVALLRVLGASGVEEFVHEALGAVLDAPGHADAYWVAQSLWPRSPSQWAEAWSRTLGERGADWLAGTPMAKEFAEAPAQLEALERQLRNSHPTVWRKFAQVIGDAAKGLSAEAHGRVREILSR